MAWKTSVVGPGTDSAASYQRASWLGQKYGPLKISCKHSICTPFFPAAWTSGMCFSTAAAWISATGRASSFNGFEHWIKPPRTILDTHSSSGFRGLPARDHDLAVGVEV